MRILLIEDEPANRALVRAILSRAGGPTLEPLEILDAPTLADARAILASTPIDVALVDVRMPDGNGLELAAELARRPAAERPRTVIVSASVLPTERASALATGADAFLGKPLVAGDLVGLLREYAAA